MQYKYALPKYSHSTEAEDRNMYHNLIFYKLENLQNLLEA